MKYTVITGASQGIGMEISVEFAKLGKNLILIGRNREKLDILANRLVEEFDIDVRLAISDLANIDFIGEITNQIGQCDVEILVNNAGIGLGGKFSEQDCSEIAAMLNLNIHSVVQLTRLLLPKIVENRGSIINIASTAAFQPVPFMAAYSASKSFILNWSESLGYELKKDGVTVLTFCPGWTKTDFIQTAKLESSKLLKPSLHTPQQVAKWVVNSWKKKKSLVIPGILNRFLIFGGRFAPRSVLLMISSKTVGH